MPSSCCNVPQVEYLIEIDVIYGPSSQWAALREEQGEAWKLSHAQVL